MADIVSFQAKIGGVAPAGQCGITAVGFGVIAAQGRMHGLTAGFRGIEGVGAELGVTVKLSRTRTAPPT